MIFYVYQLRMLIQELFGKKIAIIWFGKEGKSTLNFLLRHGIERTTITILDQDCQKEKTPELEGILTHFWPNYLDQLASYDILFKTPWMPIKGALKKYQNKIMTQTQLFFDHYPWKVIAITASKGKSTMSSLCHHILEFAGYRSKLVGNIGKPVLDTIDFSSDIPDYVVYELSSYMLHGLKKSNYLSLLGSIFPEHLDRHGSMKQYVQDKCTILKGSSINIVHEHTLQEYHLNDTFEHLIAYATDPLPEITTHLLGTHNQENIAWCMKIAEIIGIDTSIVKKAIANFHGLAHRLEYVGKYKGINFYDDAISTTPESTIAAIQSLWNQIDTIFLWGTDRGYHFDTLVHYLKKYHIQNIVLFPESGEKIQQLLTDEYTILTTKSMKEAVNFAFQHTKKWKVCLLSTASPSYSIRKNFEEKGELFQKYVQSYN